MIHHMVMWKLKPEAVATPELYEQNFARQMERFRQMQKNSPVMKDLRVYRSWKTDKDAYDFVVVMDFATREDLAAFQNSPDHQDPEARRFGMSIRDKKAVLDFETDE